MTVRIRPAMLVIDNSQLAAILTPSLLTPSTDNDRTTKATRIGTAWLRWGEAHKPTVVAPVEQLN